MSPDAPGVRGEGAHLRCPCRRLRRDGGAPAGGGKGFPRRAERRGRVWASPYLGLPGLGLGGGLIVRRGWCVFQPTCPLPLGLAVLTKSQVDWWPCSPHRALPWLTSAPQGRNLCVGDYFISPLALHVPARSLGLADVVFYLIIEVLQS